MVRHFPRTLLVSLCGIALLAGLTACGQKDDPATSSPARAKVSEGLVAVVTIPPLKSLVEPLLPRGSRVQMLMTPGRSEHGYEFTPSDLAALSSADVVVWVGLGLEPQVSTFIARQSPGTQVRLCFADVVGLTPDAAEEHAHEHGHDHAASPTEAGHDDHDHGHDHGPVDPHLWLDPQLVLKLLPSLQAGVQHAMEQRGDWNAQAAQDMAKAAQALRQRVEEVDRAYATRLEPLKGRALVTHHAAFSRLAERYGLRVAAVIRNTEGAEPEAGKLAEVVEAIKREQAAAIFVEPQFDATMARRLAEAAGVKMGTLDPLGSGDWFATMNANLDELTKAMGP